jgi:hypothetical protein
MGASNFGKILSDSDSPCRKTPKNKFMLHTRFIHFAIKNKKIDFFEKIRKIDQKSWKMSKNDSGFEKRDQDCPCV